MAEVVNGIVACQNGSIIALVSINLQRVKMYLNTSIVGGDLPEEISFLTRRWLLLMMITGSYVCTFTTACTLRKNLLNR